MFTTQKIINDPVYGIINLPGGLIYELLSHPYLQRLRRISQLGLSNLVYPGANHTRFHHAIGALHLAMETLEMLSKKGIILSNEEQEGLAIAVLCHDLGHGPFSHVLEHRLTGLHHETMTLAVMQELNFEFSGKLDIAIQIFKDTYPRKFLHQLVSGQLDLDRMDYLNRDSFFTGVAEGKIGYDRIIKMFTVKDDMLAVEEKGIYSVEKFLMARRLMYWQVYLHKTVLAAEQMLIRVIERARELYQIGHVFTISHSLAYFLSNNLDNHTLTHETLQHFIQLDDYDIWWALKQFSDSVDPELAYISQSIINRHLFKAELRKEPFTESEYMARIIGLEKLNFPIPLAKSLVLTGQESNEMYNTSKDEIMILMKDGAMKSFSEISDYPIRNVQVRKYFICYPKQSYI